MISRSTAVLCIFLGLGMPLVGMDSQFPVEKWQSSKGEIDKHFRRLDRLGAAKKHLRECLKGISDDISIVVCGYNAPGVYCAVSLPIFKQALMDKVVQAKKLLGSEDVGIKNDLKKLEGLLKPSPSDAAH